MDALLVIVVHLLVCAVALLVYEDGHADIPAVRKEIAIEGSLDELEHFETCSIDSKLSLQKMSIESKEGCFAITILTLNRINLRSQV